jgi:hypothetical protein
MFLEKVGEIRPISGIRVSFFRFCRAISQSLEARQGFQNEL